MSSSTKHILVPIGFSDQSLIALEQATHVAKVLKARITLLSVIEESQSFFGLLGDNQEDLDNLKLGVSNQLKALIAKSESSGLTFDSAVVSGSVYEEIVQYATDNEVSLIVMGTDGKPSNISKRFIGSNAYRVVTSAPCPVITIKGQKHKEGAGKIILPLDLEKETKEKVGSAIQFAKLFGAEIHVISVNLSKDEFITNTLNRNLKSVTKVIEEKGVKVVSKMLLPKKGEDFSESLLRYANQEEADLIMIMTQQENPITEFFLGSSAQTLIYESRIPVMSIRPRIKHNLVYDLP